MENEKIFLQKLYFDIDFVQRLRKSKGQAYSPPSKQYTSSNSFKPRFKLRVKPVRNPHFQLKTRLDQVAKLDLANKECMSKTLTFLCKDPST